MNKAVARSLTWALLGLVLGLLAGLLLGADNAFACAGVGALAGGLLAVVFGGF